jgi:multidrug efflux system membrane fusion protein
MLEGTFANQNERLWPNQFVDVHLVEFIRHNAVTVPGEAVMTGPTGAYVYVVGAGNKVSRVNVEVTATQQDIAVIAKGLKAGEEVATNGQYRLDQGVEVSIQPPKTTTGQRRDDDLRALYPPPDRDRAADGGAARLWRHLL